jgi:hypothetical protein
MMSEEAGMMAAYTARDILDELDDAASPRLVERRFFQISITVITITLTSGFRRMVIARAG